MELFTLDRNFHKKDIIDEFGSFIWTERYYGDSEVELIVPPNRNLIQSLPVGIFLGIEESDEIMILETRNIEPDKMKLTGISLLKWMNNRFVRSSAAHEDRYLYIPPAPPGELLWLILYFMCVDGSPYLDGTNPIGIANPERFAIPGLGLNDYDNSGEPVSVGIPYGPVYDAMKELATTYEIGMQILLEEVTDTSFSLGFRSYKGVDRTSGQSANDIVRFSPQMESFTDIKDLESIASFKTDVYTFAPSNPNGLATTPGMSRLFGDMWTGFDLRALQVFAEDITTDQVGNDAAILLNILNSRAQDALITNRFIKAVDGQIVSESQIKYGIHYNLGDIIEVQGNSGTIQAARVTEYIRSQDSTGQKEYPTVAVID